MLLFDCREFRSPHPGGKAKKKQSLVPEPKETPGKIHSPDLVDGDRFLLTHGDLVRQVLEHFPEQAFDLQFRFRIIGRGRQALLLVSRVDRPAHVVQGRFLLPLSGLVDEV